MSATAAAAVGLSWVPPPNVGVLRIACSGLQPFPRMQSLVLATDVDSDQMGFRKRFDLPSTAGGAVTIWCGFAVRANQSVVVNFDPSERRDAPATFEVRFEMPVPPPVGAPLPRGEFPLCPRVDSLCEGVGASFEWTRYDAAHQAHYFLVREVRLQPSPEATSAAQLAQSIARSLEWSRKA